MITPSSGNLVETSQTKTFDGIWIVNLNVNSPSPTQKSRASITICPFNSQNGQLSQQRKMIMINDLMEAAASSSYIQEVMDGVFKYVQEQVVSKSLF